jgi:hypothetical protein
MDFTKNGRQTFEQLFPIKLRKNFDTENDNRIMSQ